MPFLLVDDRMAQHRKIQGLSDRAFRLHMEGLLFCAANLTDGLLTVRDVRGLCANMRATKKHITELVEAGLWVDYGHNGYIIHGYLDHNPSRAEVEAKREKRAAAGRLGGINSGATRRAKGVLPPEEARKRQRATVRANTAERLGKIVREPCALCGSEENLEKHHFDYDKPEEITWLCRSCHVGHHNQLKRNEATASSKSEPTALFAVRSEFG